ncbi:MAG: hypothetical protein EXS30_11665 [Pedosphaera sp.]|nr:hypothetical protein [Pedosphaera sp.]
MRTRLRILAAGLAAFSMPVWLFLGANLGWTKTSVTKWVKDPVTELDGPIIEKRFVPGVDLLAAAGLASAVLFGISFVKTKTGTANLKSPHRA